MHKLGTAAVVCTLFVAASAVGPATASMRPGQRIVGHGSAVGTVTAIDGSALAIQTPGRRIGVVNALLAAADRVTSGDYPYVYGGGHAQAGVPSIGIKGPGYNGRRTGFDCSGSVAAVLPAQDCGRPALACRTTLGSSRS